MPDYFGVGGELLRDVVTVIRLGSWADPDHKLRYEGNDPVLATRFPEGKDELHLSVGIGLAFGEIFQVDVATDRADTLDITSISVTLFFP